MRILLLLQIGLVLMATAASASPKLRPDFAPAHLSERFLLHRQVEPANFRAFQIWDSHLATWRMTEPAEIPAERASVTVLHLWADWCAPCREELPLLRQLHESISKAYGDRIQLVMLSETSSPEAMRAFLDKHRERMPRGPQYLDTSEALAKDLRTDLTSSLSYPVTLVLDSQRVVRHVIVGSLGGRRAELFLAFSRLLRLAGTSSPNSVH